MNPLAQKFRVAVYDEFLDAFAKLPRAQQKKVSQLMRKFRADPTSPSFNYEKISSFRDPNMRTVRIDQQYRAVILKPEQGNIYVLLWVDNHDEAMAWAENKQVIIHPETGSLQVLVAEPSVCVPAAVVPAPSAPKKAATAATQPLSFGSWSDAELVGLGIPEQALPDIRGIRTDTELDGLSARLPQEAYEALFFLASGETIETVRQALAVEKPTTIDPTDFAAALDTAASQRRFTIVTDKDLTAILDAPLEKVAGFPPSQPGEAGRQELQRPGQGDGRRRHGQDRGGHAPGQAPGLQSLP